ncbi:MAG: hypothetical protein K2X35_25640 [Bryobacteraceae bacterium]|nr:hypothetical protein [Bryobacteraceae bacterium]
MAHHTAEIVADNYTLEPARWAKGRNVLAFLALVSWVGLAAGFAMDREQFFRSYLIGFLYPLTIVLGATFFVMVQYLSGSVWSMTVRRIMENVMSSMPAAALLFLPIAFGIHDIFPWSHEGHVKDPSKASYLSPQFFTIRAIVYLVLWNMFALMIYRASTKQDTTRSIDQTRTALKWSAPGVFFLFITASLAAFDWIMSLDPHWYSTMFGVYILAGGALAFMALLTLLAIGFRRAGILKNSITMEHYHDLGKWMFALTAFYTYIAFCQYMLIWYANIPEEVVFYKHRVEGSWLWVSIFMIFARFFIPFFTLLARSAKRNLTILTVVAIWILFVQFVDLFWLVKPTWAHHGVSIHWMDVASLVATTSVFGLVFWSRFKTHAMVPVGDLRFEQGLKFENA